MPTNTIVWEHDFFSICLTLSYKDMAIFISFKIRAVFNRTFKKLHSFAILINHSNLILTDTVFSTLLFSNLFAD